MRVRLDQQPEAGYRAFQGEAVIAHLARIVIIAAVVLSAPASAETSPQHFSPILNVMRRVVASVSARIAKLSPDAIRLGTPFGVLGVRITTLALRVSGP